jgi:phage protein D
VRSRALALLGAAVVVAGCGTSKAEEAAKTALVRFKSGQVCSAASLVPTESRYKTACEAQQRKEKAEREQTEAREANERRAKEKKEAAEKKAEEAKTKHEEAETRGRERHEKEEEEKKKYAEEHKGEAENHHRWSEEVRHTFVTSCEAAAAEGEANKNKCECVTNHVEAVESEEQLLLLERGAIVDGKEILERLALKAREGC